MNCIYMHTRFRVLPGFDVTGKPGNTNPRKVELLILEVCKKLTPNAENIYLPRKILRGK